MAYISFFGGLSACHKFQSKMHPCCYVASVPLPHVHEVVSEEEEEKGEGDT